MPEREAGGKHGSVEELTASFSPARRRLLERLLAAKGLARRSTLQPRDRKREHLPLSFGQRRIWFLDQLHPDTALHHAGRVLRLCGAVQVSALERSLQELVHRHEILRSVYRVAGKEPFQVVLAPAPFPLPQIDLGSLPRALREQESQRLRGDFWHAPFDLSQGPVFRCCLQRLRPQELLLICSVHHIAADAWSMEILGQEFIALYSFFSGAGGESPAPLAVQYADYACWQHDSSPEVRWREALRYWREHLANGKAVVDLPFDHCRPAQRSARAGVEARPLALRSQEAMAACDLPENITPFMFFLAVFKLLLFRWTGEEDLQVGAPASHRPEAKTEGVIGFFLNTLVLRTKLSGEWTFKQLLHHVRRVVIEGFEHQEVPFEAVVDALEAARDPGQNPLFNILFVYYEGSGNQGGNQLPSGLSLEILEAAGESAKVDLELRVLNIGDCVTLRLIYCQDLFSADTAQCLLTDFQVLLDDLTARPDCHLLDFNLRLEEEVPGSTFDGPVFDNHNLFRFESHEA